MAVEHAAALPGSHDDGGKLVLRLVLGVLVLFHGVAKIIGGPAFVVGLVTKAGLPGAFGYAVYLGEVLGPILILRNLVLAGLLLPVLAATQPLGGAIALIDGVGAGLTLLLLNAAIATMIAVRDANARLRERLG